MQALARSLFVSVLIAAPALPATAQPLTFAKTDHPSALGARAVVTADFNRDGWPDVAHAGLATSKLSILLNAPGEGFAPAIHVPIGIGAFDLTTGDFNRDGIPDLAVANADSNTLSILLGRGDGRFTRTDITTGASPRGITTGDVNQDGTPDLAYTAYDGAAVEILLGDGAGGFVVRWGLGYAAQPQGIVTADFTRDGHPDVAVACNAPEGLIVWRGPAGSYLPTAVPGAAYLNVLATADLNGDGWMDVAAASTYRGRVAIYLGAAAGLVFARSYVVDGDPRGITIADVNGDGAPDVITANRATSTVTVLPGDPAHRGSFLPRLTFAAGLNSRAIAAADFNADGLPDLVTGNQYAAAVSVLSNITPVLPAALVFGRSTLPSGVAVENRVYQNEGRGLGAADFNRDGRLDFVQRVAGSNDAAVVLTGGPTVVLPAVPPQPDEPRFGNIVGDFNGDGNADVVVNDGTQLLAYLGDGRGGFGAMSTPRAAGPCVAGDVNRDATPDLVCTSDLLLGNGDGTFRLVAGLPLPASTSNDFADINRDGKLDLVSGCAEFWLGDGAGGFSFGGLVSDNTNYSWGRAADMNHDGYVDLVCSDGATGLAFVPGGAAGFGAMTEIYGQGLEENTDFAIADVNVDGHLDIVLNFLGESADAAGVMTVLTGRGDGTFTSEPFAMAGGEVLIADVIGNGVATPDGLPDIVVARGREIVVLSNRRSQTNRPPVIESTDVAVAYNGFGGETQCFALPVQARDPDQHALWVEWRSEGPAVGPGPNPSGLMGRLMSTMACTDGPGTYRFQVTVSDFRGAVVSRTVTATVLGPTEIVLHMTRMRVVAGEWAILGDASAASGLRAYNRNRVAPKVTVPAAQPDDFIEIGFVADPNHAYKLWLRLKADRNSWANDSVWVQFSGATSLEGDAAYRIGTTSGLPVNLEECANCGISGWGWEDDGWGVPGKNGVLLRFPGGGQQVIRVQTREDGVSIDQIVLSAESYLTSRPGSGKNDTTILSETR